MNTKEHPSILEEIKALCDNAVEIQLATKHPDLLNGLMAISSGKLKYALDTKRQLVGLNLAEAGLDDSSWQKIIALLERDGIRLQALNLSYNKLERLELPVGINALQDFEVDENPLVSPPPEIAQQGGKAVLAWFASFEKGDKKTEHYLKEIKVLLVGEGMAGKTSLLKKIKDLPFNESESQTHGVNVETLVMGDLPMFKSYEAVKDVAIHVWDFGGQEIMHASHQFFLTHRSIYIFVLDSRTDNKKDYWLRHIQKFGGKSPAIVVINKIDENKSYSLEESTLNSKYPFLGNRFIKMSCKTDFGVQQFAETLATLIPETSLFKTPISESWLNIKNKLETETATKRYISDDRFLEICEENAETDSDAQYTLLRYLNSLGVVLHFPSLSLKGFYVLDPHWVTIGVYKIINSPSIRNGMLAENKLDFILNKEEQKKGEYDPNKEKKIRYTHAEQLYLIGIMKEFELLYEYKKNHYLVPDLLPKELAEPVSFKREDAVAFIMEYDFLPSNIMTQFIIHMKNDIHDLDKLWRTGVLLSNEKCVCTALVTADKERQRITIVVNGAEHRKREYFSIIRHGLWVINNKFVDLKVTEKMPVPGHPEVEMDYEDLLGQEKMKEDKLTIGRLGKSFSVSRDFLDKISTKEARQHGRFHEGMMVNIKVDNRETHERLKRIEQIAEKTKKDTTSIRETQRFQQTYLDLLLTFAEESRLDIKNIFKKVDSVSDTQDLDRINDFLEKQLDHYFEKLPQAKDIVKEWEKTKTEKLPHEPDAKWKMKFKIPFLFGEIEKELAWDARAGLKLLKTELLAFKNGEKTLKELFVE